MILFVYYIFFEKIPTLINQSAVPQNNIYFLKKELSGYLNFSNFKYMSEKNTWKTVIDALNR